MFDSFKKKLSGWIKKSTEKVKEVFVDETKVKKGKKTKAKKKQEKKQKPVKTSKEEKVKIIEEKEIEVPTKFDSGKLKVEPDLEEIEENIEEIKQEKEEETKEDKQEKKGFFSRLFTKSKFKITQEYFDSIFNDLEMLLLENNVAFDAVENLRKEMESKLIDKEVDKENIQEEIQNSLKDSIKEMLISPFDLMEKIKKKTDSPYVILFFGINGSGKTTTIAKLAHLLQKNNISCLLAAGDTFRAASIEQLQEHGNRLNIEVIKSKYNADPASVAFDAIKHAKSKGIKTVLIDTAGRMYTKSDLMREMEKISRVSKPDLKIFIAESITGNDATEQAKTFNEAIGIDGIILSKADVDEKPGAVLSVSYITKKPILYLGIGQEYKDLETFDKDKVIERLGL